MTNQIDISPIISGAVSLTDLLKPKGTFQMIPSSKRNGSIFENEGTFFIVKGENFHFQLSIDKTGLYVERNGESCVLTPDMLVNRHLQFFILTWSPDRLRLMTAEEDDKVIEIVKYTDPCSVPISLKRWARDKSLIPTKHYQTEKDFRDAVYLTLSDLKSKIEDNASGKTFWDYVYDGNKLKEKNPKKEVLVQPLIKTIIDTELYIRGIDVFRENTTPAGDIDFTVVGSVINVGVVNMCIELKNAHSQNLEDGLTRQLPGYMRSQNSQYGAYCVLNYSIDNSGYKERGELVQRLSLFQINSNDDLVRTKIRTFVIDLDEKVAAAKKK